MKFIAKYNKNILLSLFIFIFFLYPGNDAETTPLFSMQSAKKCDTCHVMPDPSDPKWVEENYNLGYAVSSSNYYIK